MYFCVNEFEVAVNDSIFSSNEQQKVYFLKMLVAELYTSRGTIDYDSCIV